jgi:hypothetical protein
MLDDGSWKFDFQIKLKDSNEIYDLTLIANWYTESIKVETLKNITD